MSGDSKSRSEKVKRSSQHGVVLWHGMRLREMWQLLKQDPELDWSRWNRILPLPLMGCYNSMMGWLEQRIFGRRIESTALAGPPLFVLGFWRSGTTLLHGLLNRDPLCVSPTTYQTLFPWHFLLTEKWVSRATGWLMPRSRPMDNIPVSWNAPQEDDIALCIMSLISPYSMLATPEDFREYWRSLDFDSLTDEELQRWKNCLLLLLRKITVRDSRRIVLKSPSHTFRIPTLLEMFPHARFVYIYRNPWDVVRSSVHLRRTMIEENGLGRAIFKDVEQEIVRSYQAGFAAYERDRRLIPEGHLHEVRFEDLERNPLDELEMLYESLSLPGFGALRQILLPEIPQLKRYRKNEFHDDTAWKAQVCRELEPAFRRFGYSLRGTLQQGRQPQDKHAATSDAFPQERLEELTAVAVK